MKNILSKEEFKKLNEAEVKSGGADFSNRTKFSQSLIGRAMNKLFSFIKRSIDMQILKGLKSELEDEYLKGIIIALAKLGKKPEDIEAEQAKKEEFNNLADEEEKEQVEKGNIILYTEEKKEEDKKVKKISVVKFIDKQTKEETIKTQLSFVKSLKGKLDPTEISSDVKGYLANVKNQLEEEIKKVGDDSEALSVLTNMKKDIDSITGEQQPKPAEEYKEKIEDFKRKEQFLVRIGQLEKKVKELERNPEVVKKHQEDISKIKKILNVISYEGSGEGKTSGEIEKSIKSIDNILSSINVNESVQNYDFIFESLLKELESYDKTYKINESKVSDLTFKKLFNFKRKEDKEYLKPFENQKISGFDFDKIVEIFSTPENNTILRNSVNKEALKEIQIKAEWLYDTEKWKDARDDVYSRVNWTTTHPDMKKLEKSWKQMVSNVKKAYNPIYSSGEGKRTEKGEFIHTGNFPEELDPIALVNSDKNFRQNFKQYGERGSYADGLKNTSGPSNPTPKESKDPLGFKDAKTGLRSGQLGILRVRTTTKKCIGILTYKFEKNNSHLWYFCGLVDLDTLSKEAINREKSDVDVLIKKYTYTDKSRISDKELRDLFDVLRPAKSPIPDNYDPNNLFDCLVTKYNIYHKDNYSPTNFIQCTIYDNNAYVSETNTNKTAYKVAIKNLIDYKNIEKNKQSDYNLWFEISEIFYMDEKERWIQRPFNLGALERCNNLDITDNAINQINTVLFQK